MEIEEWFRISKDLASQALRLERRQSVILRGFEDILREERSDDLQRQSFNQKTYKKLTHVKEELSRIQKCIQDVCSASADPRKLQDMLERFEASMTEYKASMRVDFTALASEEASLSSELDALSSQVLEWEREALLAQEVSEGTGTGDAQAAEAEAQHRRIQEKQALLMEYHAKIGQLDRKLVSMGGRTGGWDARDHDAFLKVLTVLQHKSQAAADEIEAVFLSSPTGDSTGGGSGSLGPHAGATAQGEELMVSAPMSPPRHAAHAAPNLPQVAPRKEISPGVIAKFIAMVPGKTPDEIEDHLRWHFAVAVIQNEKKRVLAEWREEKARQQLQRHKVVGEAGGCEEGHAPGAINSPGGGHNGNADDDHYYDEVRLAAKRAQVEEWRRQKAEEKKQKEIAAAEEQARQLALAEEEAFLRKQQNRLKLEQWKEAMRVKEQMTATEKSNVEVRSKSADPAEIRRRQERDKEMALRRLEKTSSKQSAMLERERRLRESESNRLKWEGPSKLLDSTTAYVRRKVTGEELDNAEYQRLHGSAHSKKIAGAGYDLRFSGRAIPTWRKGLY